MNDRSVSSALLAFGLLACSSVEPITSCDPIGRATPLGGFQNPEDRLVRVDTRER